MFAKVLVANRGEIAVRILRACTELGIRSVAVYSEADCDSLHARIADEAHSCGAAPARESYLNVERMIAIAQDCGADAIHPGYGFLSENAALADACARAGIRFIGPSGDVIRAMGSKVTSRRTAVAAGVPIVPGAIEALTDDDAVAFAREIGFPVMVKASGGGGGRGLRRVEAAADLTAALDRARSEAAASFGDDAIYIEKRIDRPRHVEVQVLADDRGNAVQLFERECSIQRRHQKLLEEAPATRVSSELREQMGTAALAMTRAVGYAGAGTCEFLVAPDGEFYFLEMNTRVQVEHAITEEITGVDIVREMIRIAAGETLAPRQSELAIRGHAIEARIYAENPDKKFLPSPGTISAYRAPTGSGIRVDSGVEAGSVVTVHYDALLAKLIAWGEDRAQAIDRLRAAVEDFQIEGVHTSLLLHARILEHPEFLAGRYDTSFLQEHFGAP